MMRRDAWILTGMALILIGVNAGYRIFNQPPAIATATMPVPETLGGWHGVDVQHTEDERAVLGDVNLIKRTYSNAKGEYLWLILHQTPAVSRLHNVYVSLIASGSKPIVLGQREIQTTNGVLAVSKIKTVNISDNGKEQPRYGYLWYQWRDQENKPHHAANRWRWYAGVLKQRASGYIPAWQLVEVFTPADDPQAAPDMAWKRLDGFARQIYELSDTGSDTSSGRARN